MPALTRTRTVLHRTSAAVAVNGHAEPVWFGPAPNVWTLKLDAGVWDDMGRPDTLTVTIDPGDQLNP